MTNQGKNCDCMRNVSCDVQTCIYNNHDHRCTADSIAVTNQHTGSSTEAACGTYRSSSSCNCR